ncbi:MAG TPA: hypothetical protein VEO00_00060 [Actinomycetota bacterium]|nr:hypothetical protein [Actinomycetota bacterium]
MPASAGVGPDPTQPCDPEFTGTSGDDVIFGSDWDDVICGRAGNDKLFGGDGEDVLKGQDGNDQLFGGDDSDSLVGGIGGDRLVAGFGVDLLNGGPGKDTADYSLTCGVIGSLNTGFIDNCADDDYVTFANGVSTVENLIGSPVFNDELEGDGQANEIRGNGGNDFISGRGGEDRLFGEAGDDLIRGDGGDDFINGGDQSTIGDVCSGGAGTNTIINCFP